MAESSYSNWKAFEGTCTTDTTLTFDWRPRSVTITNDGPASLSFKFNSGETYATLKVGETVSPDVIVRNVYITSSNADYRIWGIG